MSTPSFEIGRAEIADLDALERIERECFAADMAFPRRQLRDLLHAPSAAVRVLRHEGRVVADAITLRRQGSRGVTARIYTLAVLPEHRGKGFGKALLAACLEDLRSVGAGSIRLEVGVENASGIGLYEAFGFRRIGRLCDYYALGLDAWRMRMDL